MARPVSADHILFDECINEFRSKSTQISNDNKAKHSYLLTSFRIPSEWQLPDSVIGPSTRVHLPGPHASFISKVDNPKWCDPYKPHLYGIALSAIVTFVTGHLCKSTRDDYSHRGEALTDEIALELSLAYPVKIAGPGSATCSLPSATLAKYNADIAALIQKLHETPYSTYITLIQAIRLIHLSEINKKDDFGLAYLLTISAIESIAQIAIPRKKMARKHLKENEWTIKSKDDPAFAELFHAYKEARGNNNYLKERYVKFIKTYAPSSDWETIVPHPYQEHQTLNAELTGAPDLSFMTQRHPFEVYPSDLTEEHLENIIADSYKHRSFFVHRGEQPPHQPPHSCDRFFERRFSFNEGDSTLTTILLPNFDLIKCIARHSICNWLNTIIKT